MLEGDDGFKKWETNISFGENKGNIFDDFIHMRKSDGGHTSNIPSFTCAGPSVASGRFTVLYGARRSRARAATVMHVDNPRLIVLDVLAHGDEFPCHSLISRALLYQYRRGIMY